MGSRRSSILKTRKSSTDDNPVPFLDLLKEKNERRVSFASSKIKPFASDPEENTVWDITYEEDIHSTLSPHVSQVSIMNKTALESPNMLGTQQLDNTSRGRPETEPNKNSTSLNDKKRIFFPSFASDVQYTSIESVSVHTKRAKLSSALDFNCLSSKSSLGGEQTANMEFTCLSKNKTTFESMDLLHSNATLPSMEYTCAVSNRIQLMSEKSSKPVLLTDILRTGASFEKSEHFELSSANSFALPSTMEFTCALNTKPTFLQQKEAVLKPTSISDLLKTKEDNSKNESSTNSSALASNMEFTCALNTEPNVVLHEVVFHPTSITDLLKSKENNFKNEPSTNSSALASKMEFTCALNTEPDDLQQNEAIFMPTSISDLLKSKEDNSKNESSTNSSALASNMEFTCALNTEPDDLQQNKAVFKPTSISDLLQSKEDNSKNESSTNSSALASNMEFTCALNTEPDDLQQNEAVFKPTSISDLLKSKEDNSKNESSTNFSALASNMEFTCALNTEPDDLQQNKAVFKPTSISDLLESKENNSKNESSTNASALASNMELTCALNTEPAVLQQNEAVFMPTSISDLLKTKEDNLKNESSTNSSALASNMEFTCGLNTEPDDLQQNKAVFKPTSISDLLELKEDNSKNESLTNASALASNMELTCALNTEPAVLQQNEAVFMPTSISDLLKTKEDNLKNESSTNSSALASNMEFTCALNTEPDDLQQNEAVFKPTSVSDLLKTKEDNLKNESSTHSSALASNMEFTCALNTKLNVLQQTETDFKPTSISDLLKTKEINADSKNKSNFESLKPVKPLLKSNYTYDSFIDKENKAADEDQFKITQHTKNDDISSNSSLALPLSMDLTCSFNKNQLLKSDENTSKLISMTELHYKKENDISKKNELGSIFEYKKSKFEATVTNESFWDKENKIPVENCIERVEKHDNIDFIASPSKLELSCNFNKHQISKPEENAFKPSSVLQEKENIPHKIEFVHAFKEINNQTDFNEVEPVFMDDENIFPVEICEKNAQQLENMDIVSPDSSGYNKRTIFNNEHLSKSTFLPDLLQEKETISKISELKVFEDKNDQTAQNESGLMSRTPHLSPTFIDDSLIDKENKPPVETDTIKAENILMDFSSEEYAFEPSFVTDIFPPNKIYMPSTSNIAPERQKDATTSFYLSHVGGGMSIIADAYMHSNSTKSDTKLISDTSSLCILDISEMTPVSMVDLLDLSILKRPKPEIKEYDWALKEKVDDLSRQIIKKLETFEYKPFSLPFPEQKCSNISEDLEVIQKNVVEKDVTLMGRVKQRDEKTKKWSFVSCHNKVFQFKVWYGAVSLSVSVNLDNERVEKMEFAYSFNKTVKVEPLDRFIVKCFLDRLNDHYIKPAIGNVFNLMTLLDYVELVTKKLAVFWVFVQDNINEYNIEFEDNFMAHFTIFSCDLMIQWKFCVNMNQVDNINKNSVEMQAVYGDMNKQEILQLFRNCPSGLDFFVEFIQNLQQYVDKKALLKRKRNH